MKIEVDYRVPNRFPHTFARRENRRYHCVHCWEIIEKNELHVRHEHGRIKDTLHIECYLFLFNHPEVRTSCVRSQWRQLHFTADFLMRMNYHLKKVRAFINDKGKLSIRIPIEVS